MIVTIYKNCKLNNKYKDVFYNKTYLEGYLATLTSRIIVNDSELFSRNNDSLYVDGINIPDFKQYNFLKIEDSIGTFYAFINNIEWINEVYYIHYEEDILSNYFENVHIRNSLLTCNKSLKLYKGQAQKNIDYYKLPILPESNNFIQYIPYNIEEMEQGQEYPEVSIIVKLQYYYLVSGGNQSNRAAVLGFIRFFDRDNNFYETYKFAPDTANTYIEYIINNANSFQIGTDRYYEIDKIYVVPSSYIDTNVENFNVNKTTIYDISGDMHKTLSVSYYNINGQNFYGLIKTYNKIINYDRKNDSIGLFSLPIKVLNNGTNINVKIEFYIRGYEIKFILNVQNKIIDITEEFNVDLPYYQLNASAVHLQRLQLDLEKNSLNNKIDNSNEELNRNATNLVIGTVGGIGSGIVSSMTGNAFGAVLSTKETLMNASNTYAGMVTARNDINYATEKINLIDKALYSNSSIKNNKFSIINGIFGLCLFKITEDNTEQVDTAIKLNGYIIRELVNDVIQELDIEHLTDHYEVFKFDEVNLYGVIAQDYLRVIERVLLNGVRVWCQNDIGELI